MTDKHPASSPAEPAAASSRSAEPGAAAHVEARVRVPAAMRDRIDAAAAGRGVSRTEFLRAALDRALAVEEEPPPAVAGDGDTELYVDGAAASRSGPAPIPEAYVARSPLPAAAAAAPDAPAAPVPGSTLGLSGPAAGNGAGPADAAVEPGAEAGPAGVDEPPAAPRAAAPRGFSPLVRLAASFAAALLVLGVAALVLSAVEGRYRVHAPAPGATLAGAYVLDAWTGRVWFCDAALRGRDLPRCRRFAGLVP